MTDYPFIQARWLTHGRIKPVQLIVIHDMEAPEKGQTAENIAHYFATTDTKASAHFCVDNNSVIQCVQTSDTAWHCKNANSNGVGVEHAGYAKQTREEWLDDYGQAMLDRSAKLCAELCKQFNIPASMATFASKANPTVIKPGFAGHYDIPNHGVHHDPYRIDEHGKVDTSSFPWDWFLERVARYLAQEG